MTKARKTALSLALAAAMGGAVSTVNAVNLAEDLLGDVLLFPYYTVNDNWQTLLHLINTSNTHSIAVKIRFQEAWVSRDVLDFVLVLSPNDVWTGFVGNDAGGQPRLYSTDTSCTSPVSTAAGFPFLALNTGNNINRSREGHITIIEMGAAASGTAIDTAAKAKNCTTIDTAFLKANIDATSNQFGEPLNVLKGEFVLLKRDVGLSMGGSPVTLANFFTPTLDYGPPNGNQVDGATVAAAGGVAGNYGVTNLITAQQYPDFLLPTLNDAKPRQSVFRDDTAGVAQTVQIATAWVNGVDAVSAVLQRSNVVNEWSTNPANGVQTYWAVSFPTKLHYVDAAAQPTSTEVQGITGYAAGNGVANGVAYVGGPAPFSTTWSDANKSCDTVTFNLFDRQEGSVTAGGTSISPAPPTPAQSLCYEVNVLTFDPNANLLGSGVATAVDVTKLVSKDPYGWLNLALPAGATNVLGGTAAASPVRGLPVTGFAMWSRDFGDPNKNYGNLIPHSFTRAITPPNGG